MRQSSVYKSPKVMFTSLYMKPFDLEREAKFTTYRKIKIINSTA